LDERQYQFEWDQIKAAANETKHGVSFELASTVFTDPGLLTVPDLELSGSQERWFSVGLARWFLSCIFGQNPSNRSQKSGSFLRAGQR
jgi:uncharacterized DUF497 family protein